MSEQLKESMSAVFDDEADAFELRRVLDEAAGNEELRDHWHRLQLMRDVMRNDDSHLRQSLRERLFAELESEGHEEETTPALRSIEGGKGVFKIWYESHQFKVDNAIAGTRSFENFAAVMAYLTQGQVEPPLFCRFLNRTDAGDKRVVVVDGEIYGSYLRRSKRGHWVNNVSIDGECTLADISTEEVAAIEATVKHYQAMGLHTLGYDFLMDDDGTWRISEINAGNIGGFARLELLSGQPMMDRLIEWMMEFAQRPSVASASSEKFGALAGALP